jgi:hypothetical protein
LLSDSERTPVALLVIEAPRFGSEEKRRLDERIHSASPLLTAFRGHGMWAGPTTYVVIFARAAHAPDLVHRAARAGLALQRAFASDRFRPVMAPFALVLCRASVEAIRRSLEQRTLPYFVLALGRPEARAVHPAFCYTCHTLDLPLLSNEDAAEIARFALRDRVRPELVERLVQQAEGSPLILEELLRATGDVDSSAPRSVVNIRRNRIAALSAVDRRVLRAASVVGSGSGCGRSRPFWAMQHRLVRASSGSWLTRS